MTDLSISFLTQPMQVVASRGDRFATEVIDTLRGWASSNYKDHVRAERDAQVYALSPDASTAWTMVVLRTRHDGHDRTNVCGLEFRSPAEAMDRFVPLMKVEHIKAEFEMGLDKLEPAVFAAMAASQGLAPSFEPTANRRRLSAEVMAQVDALSHRWGSTEARSNLKNLFERARQQPQIVERRGADDLVVMSRNYLQELVQPTTARTLALKYRSMALLTDGFVDPIPMPVGPLEELPEL